MGEGGASLPRLKHTSAHLSQNPEPPAPHTHCPSHRGHGTTDRAGSEPWLPGGNRAGGDWAGHQGEWQNRSHTWPRAHGHSHCCPRGPFMGVGGLTPSRLCKPFKGKDICQWFGVSIPVQTGLSKQPWGRVHHRAGNNPRGPPTLIPPGARSR